MSHGEEYFLTVDYDGLHQRIFMWILTLWVAGVFPL